MGRLPSLRTTILESGLEIGEIIVQDDQYERACDVAEAWQSEMAATRRPAPVAHFFCWAIAAAKMDVTINSYKKDKYYPRVVRAVAKILARSDVVTPVEVLVEMGNLSKKNLEAWRAGQVSYLERVFEGSLSKANRILRIIGFHVHDLNMVPSRTAYRGIRAQRVGCQIIFSTTVTSG